MAKWPQGFARNRNSVALMVGMLDGGDGWGNRTALYDETQRHIIKTGVLK